MILDDIVKAKEQDLERAKLYFSVERLKEKIVERKPAKDFAAALVPHTDKKGNIVDEVRIIGEVKRASPSKGLFKIPFYPFEVAKTYQLNGAAAISVITEEKFFRGSLDFLTPIALLKLPVLRKDFLFDEFQVFESRAAGADAILLIVKILGKDKLQSMMATADSLGMSCLVEVHDEQEMKIAAEAGAKIIGINNRDLTTFKTDINTTLKLAPLAPKGAVIVSESGINTHDDIKTLRSAGVSAFLIGEALVREENIGKKLKELRGVG